MTGGPRNVLIWTLPETGHINPTFRIADTLVSRGHHVTYLAPPLTRPVIEGRGHAVSSWFDDLYDAEWEARVNSGSTLSRRRAVTQRYNAIVDRLCDGHGVAEMLRSSQPPDVVVCDVNEPLVGLLAAHLGLPVILMHTSLPQTRDAGVPPIRRFASASVRARLRLTPTGEWWLVRGTRDVLAVVAGLVRAEPPYRITTRFARRIGLTGDRLDRWTAFFPQLRSTPEIVLCPRAFDLARPARPLRYYVESGARPSSDDQPSRPARERPLVLCSLGTQAYRTDRTPRFFHDIVQVATRRPDLQFVVALGQHMSVEAVGPTPENVDVHSSVAQVSLLGETSVMITHGGLGSVKECIRAAVPMVVVPLAVDQQANADRVAHHHLGCVVDLDTSTADVLHDAIESTLRSDTIRRGVAAMQAHFRRSESADLGADVIEAVATGSPLPQQPDIGGAAGRPTE